MTTMNMNMDIGIDRRLPDGGATDVGDRTAVTRRHMLVERMLVDILGLEWASVHREADTIAPIVSPRVEICLREVLGNPSTCPHGNPIPGVPHAPDQSHARPMTDVRGLVVVTRVDDELEHDLEAMRRLEACGLIPGHYAEVQGQNAAGVEVVGSRRSAVIPEHVAGHTYVTQVTAIH